MEAHQRHIRELCSAVLVSLAFFVGLSVATAQTGSAPSNATNVSIDESANAMCNPIVPECSRCGSVKNPLGAGCIKGSTALNMNGCECISSNKKWGGHCRPKDSNAKTAIGGKKVPGNCRGEWYINDKGEKVAIKDTGAAPSASTAAQSGSTGGAQPQQSAGPTSALPRQPDLGAAGQGATPTDDPMKKAEAEIDRIAREGREAAQYPDNPAEKDPYLLDPETRNARIEELKKELNVENGGPSAQVMDAATFARKAEELSALEKAAGAPVGQTTFPTPEEVTKETPPTMLERFDNSVRDFGKWIDKNLCFVCSSPAAEAPSAPGNSSALSTPGEPAAPAAPAAPAVPAAPAPPAASEAAAPAPAQPVQQGGGGNLLSSLVSPPPPQQTVPPAQPPYASVPETGGRLPLVYTAISACPPGKQCANIPLVPLQQPVMQNAPANPVQTPNSPSPNGPVICVVNPGSPLFSNCAAPLNAGALAKPSIAELTARLQAGHGSPVVVLLADRLTVAPGGTPTLTWGSVRTSSCTIFDSAGRIIASGGSDGTARTGALYFTTTYIAQCVGTGGGTARAQVTVTVQR